MCWCAAKLGAIAQNLITLNCIIYQTFNNETVLHREMFHELAQFRAETELWLSPNMYVKGLVFSQASPYLTVYHIQFVVCMFLQKIYS